MIRYKATQTQPTSSNADSDGKRVNNLLILFQLCYQLCLWQNTVKSAWNDGLLF